jgi:Skp family chaperone for outer membrane proteins
MPKNVIKNYKKLGIIAGAVIIAGALGVWGISALRGPVSIDRALADVSADAVSGADLRIAIIRMDEIQQKADVLVSLRKQKESYENELRKELEGQQKALEKEKTEIEKSQDVLSRDALQRRVVEYQQKVSNLQRSVTDRAQAIEMEFQKALNEIQVKHLDPIIEGITKKKDLSMVMDGRFARVSENAPAGLDITGDAINALNKRVTNIKMAMPKGF